MSEKSDLTPKKAHEYADQLLAANDADEVASILEELEEEYETEWKTLGGEDHNNYSTVHNQASSPMAAFVELVLNSADAQMLKFYDRVSDEVAPDEYTSMKEAVEADWVDLDEATIETLVDGSKPTEENFVNLTIRDDGKGKNRDEFSDFVDLHAPGLKKQKYGFCQGQYGMGSTGVMPFCGDTEAEVNERCFKFIASASANDPGKWSWTIVRDNQLETEFQYLTISGEFPQFDGEFGDSLAQKFDENYPDKYDAEKNLTPPEAQEYGSFVKVYNYETHTSRAFFAGNEGWRRKFERFVVDSPFPIRITDMRYDSKAPQTTTQGFLPELREKYDSLLKEEEHLRVETKSEQLGVRDAHVLLFKRDSELGDEDKTKEDFLKKTTGTKAVSGRTGIQQDHAVMLTINGQTHGSKSQFFLEKLGYSKTAEDTVVITEFDDLANLGAVKMFSPSRDELKDSAQTRKFITALKSALEDSDLLSEEEERRRRTRGSDEENVDTETLQEFVERNPDVADWITEGRMVEAPSLSTDEAGSDTVSETDDGSVDGPGEDETGEGQGDDDEPRIPTYLRLIEKYDPSGDHQYWDDSSGYMPVEMPVNRRTKIRMETDAQDNYLSRDVLSGSLEISPSDRFSSAELRNGILTLTLEPENDGEPGEDFGLIIQLTRPDPKECDQIDDPADALPESSSVTDGSGIETSPLKTGVHVTYTEPEEERTYTPNTDEPRDPEDEKSEKDTSEGDEESKTSERMFDMPDINRVWEESWRVDDEGDPMYEDDFDPEIAGEFDEHTVVQVDPSFDDTISGLTITINMDAAPLRRFIIDENIKENWKEFVEQRYEIAVVYYVMSQYRQFAEEYGSSFDEAEIHVSDIVETAVNGIGQTLMPTIISDDQLERITD